MTDRLAKRFKSVTTQLLGEDMAKGTMIGLILALHHPEWAQAVVLDFQSVDPDTASVMNGLSFFAELIPVETDK